MTSRYGMTTILAALLIGLATPAHAQQPAAAQHAGTPAPAAAKPAGEEDRAAGTPNKAGAQGIRVHGHWVLQVKNPDGTPGERREFDNALTAVGGSEASGDQLLGLLLSGNGVLGDPGVAFSNNVSTSGDLGTLCLNTDGKIAAGGAGCGLLTTAASFLSSTNGSSNPLSATGSVAQNGLSMLVSMSPVTWVLSGTYTVVAGQTTIGTVQTLIGVCIAGGLVPGSINTSSANNQNQFVGTATSRVAPSSPSTCDVADYHTGTFAPRLSTLTSTLVTPSALAVTPGQLIQVTVTISFS